MDIDIRIDISIDISVDSSVAIIIGRRRKGEEGEERREGEEVGRGSGRIGRWEEKRKSRMGI